MLQSSLKFWFSVSLKGDFDEDQNFVLEHPLNLRMSLYRLLIRCKGNMKLYSGETRQYFDPLFQNDIPLRDRQKNVNLLI